MAEVTDEQREQTARGRALIVKKLRTLGWSDEQIGEASARIDAVVGELAWPKA